jgi:hypothetical protein
VPVRKILDAVNFVVRIGGRLARVYNGVLTKISSSLENALFSCKFPSLLLEYRNNVNLQPNKRLSSHVTSDGGLVSSGTRFDDHYY